ncbi:MULTISPECIES: hypothetical protein [Novosphingobium]|uniref:hypothetical protein n=1 Tax=Novosphingobium TaxID=165696 RepID=UPI0003B443BF|nr:MULTISPECIES: hypothetical protein [Novosphingobium]WQD91942.1 hypothetical protein U0041_13160 [Novosphingobium capsulatum]
MTMRARNASLAALALMLAASSASLPAHAVPGGDLGTLHNGRWTCEQGGDAAILPRHVPDQEFRITPDSSYRTPDGKGGGTYILLGRAMSFTSGPYYGRTFQAQGPNTVLQLDANGKRTGVRCTRTGAPSGGFADAPEAGVNGAN